MSSTGSGAATGSAPTPAPSTATTGGSVALPDVAELKREFGLLGLAFAWETDEDLLDDVLAGKLAEAMDEARIHSAGIETFYGSVSPASARVRVLQRAVKLLAVAEVLRRPEVMKLTGTHEPLLMEDTSQFEALINDYRAQASTLLENLTDALASSPTGTAFARPAFGASTFSVLDSDRSPTQKNSLLDESDDVSAVSLVNG